MRSAFALVFLGPAVCWAQLTPQQAISVEHLSALTFSPDGGHIAFTVEGAPKGRSGPRDVWLSDGTTAHTAALTANGVSFAPRWSPDGRQLAYLSRDGGEPQIVVTTPSGANAVQLTHHQGGVLDYRWSPDGRQIAFLATDPQIQDSAEQDPRVIKIVSGSDVPTRLWIIDLASKSERALTGGTFNVAEALWKADGSALVVLASERPDPEHWTDRLYLVDPSSASHRPLFDPKAPIERLQLSPDGQSLSYVGPHGGGYTASDLYLLPLNGGHPQDLTGAALDRPVDEYHWKDDSTLIASFEFGFVDRLYTISTTGKLAPLAGFSADPKSFDYSRSGDIAFVRETASEPPELWLRERSGGTSALTALNAHWSALPRAKAELIHYTSYDGTSIEGQLLRPPGSNSGKLPTITLIHGGPVGRWSDRFDPEGQLLASHGYAVFYPNIRGAEGYGQHMIDLIRSVPRGGSGWASRSAQRRARGRGCADGARPRGSRSTRDRRLVVRRLYHCPRPLTERQVQNWSCRRRLLRHGY